MDCLAPSTSEAMLNMLYRKLLKNSEKNKVISTFTNGFLTTDPFFVLCKISERPTHDVRTIYLVRINMINSCVFIICMETIQSIIEKIEENLGF
jgi:hypothetical protein